MLKQILNPLGDISIRECDPSIFHNIPLIKIIKSQGFFDLIGLSGGDARDALVGYNGILGDSGVDIFVPDISIKGLSNVGRLFSEFVFPGTNLDIVVDNLAVKYHDYTLAGFSYSNTPCASISKVILLSTNDDDAFFVGSESAFEDSDAKLIKLHYQPNENDLSMLREKSGVDLSESELIVKSDIVNDRHIIYIACLDSCSGNFTIREKFLDQDMDLRYNSLLPSSCAKYINLAVTYQENGFNLDSSTDLFLGKISELYSDTDVESFTKHLIYKLSPDKISVLEDMINSNSWLSNLFGKSSSCDLDYSREILAKYKDKQRVILQKEDYVF